MRKYFLLIAVVISAYPAFAEGFSLNGEAKTGLLWTKSETQLILPTERAEMGSKDDAGNGQGRFRLNMEYAYANFGVKLRFNWENWSIGDLPSFPYAFGYGNFFNDQFTVSFGKLGASPWGTGGPEMWKELEVAQTGGIRFEYKPSFVPGLNVGFVLNYFNSGTDQRPSSAPVTFWNILQESVFGVSYTHEYFLIRLAYRLDSEEDYSRGVASGKEGDEFIYRLEEHILNKYLPGFQIWAMGAYYGLWCAEENKGDYVANNWLFVQYAPDLFTAQIRLGYDVLSTRQVVHVKPSFYLNLFDKLIKVGGSFWYNQDFGEFKIYPGSPFWKIEAEGLLQVNFAANAYIAFAYNWGREYVGLTNEHVDAEILPINQTQWINLRFGITF